MSNKSRKRPQKPKSRDRGNNGGGKRGRSIEEPVIPPPEPDLEENATEPEESAEELREAGWRIVEDDEIFEPGEEFRIDINSGKKWVKVKGDTVVDPEEPQVPSPDLELDTKGREGETLDTEKLAPEDEALISREALERIIEKHKADLRDRQEKIEDKFTGSDNQEKIDMIGLVITNFEGQCQEILDNAAESESVTHKVINEVEVNYQGAKREIKKTSKGSFRERFGSFLEKAKGVKAALTKPSELRGVIGKVAYDTVGSVFGVKFVGDLFLALGKKGDIYNYFSEKKQVNKDKAEILAAFMEEMGGETTKETETETEGGEEAVERSEEVVAEVENYKQKINASNLEEKDKEELKANLIKILEDHDEEAENLNEQKQEQVKNLLDTYFKTKIKGTKIAKDAMNTALVASGLFAARGLMYGVMAAAERGQKANDTFAKERLTRKIQGPETKTDEIEVQGPTPEGEGSPTTKVETPVEEKVESQLKFILRDMVVNATRENARALMLKGKEGDGEHKKADFAKAAGNLLRIAGIGSASINAFSESGLLDKDSIDTMLDAIKENGISNLGDTAKVVGAEVKDNFIQNAANVFNIDRPKDKAEVDAVDKAVEAGVTGTVAPPEDPFNLGADGGEMEATSPSTSMEDIEALHDKPMSGIDAIPGSPSGPIGESADVQAGMPGSTADAAPETPTDGPLEDIIKTEEGKSADSIWRSTKNIVMNNPERFGYDGDPADTAAMSQWAETQTANMVNALNVEQDGNLADLVHDGDKVVVNFEGDKPVLSFEADSGIEAGHLADENVEAFFADHQWEEGIEHCVEIDANTGDQYYEIDASDGTYKVYDWDRDSNPNVIFPDGHAEEMSVDKLNSLFEEKNIFMSDQEVAVADQEAMQAATARSVDQFLSGESKYSENLYDDAKANGKLDEVFHKLLGTGDKTKITPFIEDHFKANHLSDNQLNIFLRYAYANQGLAEFDGSPADLVDDFEAQTVSNFGDLKGGNADIWRTVKVGDQYALVQKFHTGMWPMRSDHYFVDFNGDGQADTQLDHDAMQAVYNKGYFGEEVPEPVPEPTKVEESEPAVKKERMFETSKASYRDTEAVKAEETPAASPEPAKVEPEPVKPGVYDFSETKSAEPAMPDIGTPEIKGDVEPEADIDPGPAPEAAKAPETNPEPVPSPEPIPEEEPTLAEVVVEVKDLDFEINDKYNNPEDIDKMKEAIKFLEDSIERDKQTLAQAESDFKAADETLAKAQEAAVKAAKVAVGTSDDDMFAKMDADFDKTKTEMDRESSEFRLDTEKATLDREQANLEDSERSLERFKRLAGEGKLGNVKYEFHEIKTGTGGSSIEHDVFKHDFDAESIPDTSATETPKPESTTPEEKIIEDP